MIVHILLGLLAVLLIYFLYFYIRDLYAHRHDLGHGSWIVNSIIGFVVDFLMFSGLGALQRLRCC